MLYLCVLSVLSKLLTDFPPFLCMYSPHAFALSLLCPSTPPYCSVARHIEFLAFALIIRQLHRIYSAQVVFTVMQNGQGRSTRTPCTSTKLCRNYARDTTRTEGAARCFAGTGGTEAQNKARREHRRKGLGCRF